MDSSKAERGRGPASDQTPGSNPEPEEPQRTPVRPSRGTKRKAPGTTPTSSKTDDLERPGSSKKHRKSTSGQPLTRIGSPGSLLKPAMTERQQMVLLKQMTSTEIPKSPASDPIEETPPRLEVTPKSRLQRRNERGETPLHVACIRGDIGTAFTLITQGAEVNATDHAGWTPLHEACNHGYVKVVVLLLKNGAAKNIRGMDGDTPLHDAAVNNHLEVVKTLLEHGADPTVPNDKGHTPIDVCKDIEILRLLKGEVEKKEKGEGGVRTGNGTETAMETGTLSDAKDQKVQAEKRFGEKGHDSMESKSERRKIMETMPVSSKHTGTDVNNVDQTAYRTESESEPLPLSHSESSSLENLSESAKKTTTGKPSRGTAKVRTGFYSDISSSESDSDYYELASRKSRRKGKPMHFVRKLEEVRENQETGEETSVAPEGRVEGDEGLDRSKEHQPQVSERSKGEGGPEGTLDESGTKNKARDDKSTEQKRDPGDSVRLQSSPKAPAQTSDRSPEKNDSEKTPMSVTDGMQVAASVEGVPAQQHSVDAPLPKLPVKFPEKEDSDAEIDVDTTSSTPTTDGEVFTLAMSPMSGSVESAGFVVSVPLSLVKLSTSKQDAKAAKADQGTEKGRDLETQMDVGQTPEVRVPDDATGSSQSKPKPSKEETASGLYYERLSHGITDTSEVFKEVATAGKAAVSDEPLSVPDSHLPPTAGRQSKDATSTPSAVTSTPIEREKHTRHGRKPQHVVSGKKLFREVKRESEAPSQLECGETLQSLSEKARDASGFSWGGLIVQSHPPKGSDWRQGASGRDGDTNSATLVGGRRGGDVKDAVQVRRVKEEDMSGQIPKQRSSDYDLEFDDDEDSDYSKSAIVSLSTSLPIVFSRHAAGLQQQQQPQQKSPPTVLTMKQEMAPSIPKDVLTTPPNFKPHTLPILLEAMKSLSTSQKKSGQSGTATGTGREISQEAEDIHIRLSLPPKKRYRGIQRSAVVQQRRERRGPPPTLPSQFNSFLMCTRDYQSKKPLQPTSPKSVYPPIHISLYKLFSEQEGERVRLTAAHLAEQDRLLLSMEQELLRAHQRATKCHTPISVCSVLLERLLPAPLEQVEVTRGEKMADTGKTDAPNTTTRSKGSSPTYSLDERLLSALVQDVWDKFHELHSSLFSRQRHEAEALWLLQRDQWTDRLIDLGLPKSPTSRHDLPNAHVPLVTSLTRQLS